MGVLAQHSNGFQPHTPDPGQQPQSAAGQWPWCHADWEFGEGPEALAICSMHLALSRRVRSRQLDFINELVGERKHLVVMGDLNAGCESSEVRMFIDKTGLTEPACDQATFPSWRPVRRIDHILVSHSLEVLRTRVVDYALSDHLPICVELVAPEAFVWPPEAGRAKMATTGGERYLEFCRSA